MAGLGLIHLGFLAAAAAVAVPVLIHFLLRPRAQRVDIGSVRFLKVALRESTRRRKLRRWLLLALRSAAVLLLAFLFARPYLSGAGAAGRDREVILLVDQSASMGAVQSGRTLFARAQEAADQTLKELPEHTAVHLAYFDAQAVAPADRARLDRGRQPGYAGTDYNRALRWARDLMVLSPRPLRQVYLFTDLQRCGLRGERFEGFPSGVVVEVVEAGRAVVRNLAVVRAEATQTTRGASEPVAVTALVRNGGAFPAKDVPVRLMLEGAGARVERMQKVSAAPGALRDVRFALPLLKPGLYTGWAEVASNDEFPPDDRRWLAVEIRRADPLLLVDGEPGLTVYGDETYYLQAALRLRLGDKGPALTPYEPVRLRWGDGTPLPDLGTYRVVVLCNVARLADADIEKLKAFVSGGGSLLIFTGDHVRPDGYEPLRRAGLVPATVQGTAGPDLFYFATWDKEHPVLRPLSDPQQGDLRRVAFHHITRLQPAPRAKVLAATQAGDPLLVEGRLGTGKVLVVATAADRDWSNWPQSRLYVPLVHQIVGYLAEALPEDQRVRQGQTGPGRSNPPGVTVTGRTALVRNLDPAESEMERLSTHQFRAALHLPEGDNPMGKQAAAAALNSPDGQRADELWAAVLWALLVVLMIELFVANRTHA